MRISPLDFFPAFYDFKNKIKNKVPSLKAWKGEKIFIGAEMWGRVKNQSHKVSKI